MQYVEALREVKKAEADVRDRKAEAQAAAAQLLRDAERQANALLDQARAEADAAYGAALENARKNGDKERAKRLQSGEKDAAAVRARANGPEFKQAIDVLLMNFEKHVSRK